MKLETDKPDQPCGEERFAAGFFRKNGTIQIIPTQEARLNQVLPYRLVAFDLDNTTLYRGELSRANRSALAALKRKGVVTVAATGRHISLMPHFIRYSRHIDYILCVTGASLYNVKTHEMRYLCSLSADTAKIAVEICKHIGGRMNLVTRERALAERAAFQSFVKSPQVKGHSRSKPSLKQMLHLLRMMTASKLMDDAAAYLDEHPLVNVEKMDAFFDDDAQTGEAVRLLLESGLFEVAVSPRYLEITAKGCTKGTGLARLYDMLGLTKADAVAFGDSGNDLSMADHAGLFVAMGNAESAVLARAGKIAPDVREDGFAAVIAELF